MQKIQIRLTVAATIAMILFNLSHPCCAQEIDDEPDRPRNEKKNIYAESICPECKKFDGKDCIPDPEQEGNDCKESGKICCYGECKTADPPDCCNPCKNAEDNGLFRPQDGKVPYGAVICCAGEKYICLFPENVPLNPKSRAHRDFMDCVRRHEEEHKNDPSISCSEESFNKSSHPTHPSVESWRKGEWDAHTNTIDCLSEKIDELEREINEQFDLSKQKSVRDLHYMQDVVRNERKKYEQMY